MQHCTNCGTPMEADALFCPSCGTPRAQMSAPTPNPMNPSPGNTPGQPLYGSSPATPGDYAATAFAPPPSAPNYGMPPSNSYSAPTYPAPPPSAPNYGPTAYAPPPSAPTLGVPPSTPDNYGAPPPPPSSGMYSAPSYGAPPASGMYSAPSYGAPPSSPSNLGVPPLPPQYATSSRQKSGVSKGMLALIIGLLVVIVLGAGGIAYYSNVMHPAQIHAQATTTAQEGLTASAQSSATANAHATTTANTQATATVAAQATMGAQATALVQGTATALQSVYTQATSGTPVVNDSLSAQSGSNWDTGTNDTGDSCTFTNGTYQISEATTGFYLPCYAQGAGTFGDAAIEVTMAITKGDGGGILFRADSNSSAGYEFRVKNDGTYSIDVSTNDTDGKAIVYNSSPLIKNGQANTLTVIAKGSTIYVFINKQYAGSVSDSTLSSGIVGLTANDSTNSTVVSFSNFKVWKL